MLINIFNVTETKKHLVFVDPFVVHNLRSILEKKNFNACAENPQTLDKGFTR